MLSREDVHSLSTSNRLRKVHFRPWWILAVPSSRPLFCRRCVNDRVDFLKQTMFCFLSCILSAMVLVRVTPHLVSHILQAALNGGRETRRVEIDCGAASGAPVQTSLYACCWIAVHCGWTDYYRTSSIVLWSMVGRVFWWTLSQVSLGVVSILCTADIFWILKNQLVGYEDDSP